MCFEVLDIPAAWIIILLFLVGSSIYSFLNAVIYRVPLHMDFITARSRCPECGHLLTFFDMLPVFGWFLLGGKCRYCHGRISLRYPLAEAFGGSMALLCVYKWGYCWRALFVYLFLAALTAVAFVDLDTLRIPNGFTAAAAAVGVLSIPFSPEPGLPERLLGVICISVPLLIIALIMPGGLGGGDIKLMAACGLFLGWKQMTAAFAVAVCAAGVYCIVMLSLGKMDRHSKLALGFFLCLGMGIVLFLPI